MRSRILCPIVALISAAAVPVHAQTGEPPTPSSTWHYTYFKKPRTLTLDVTRVAIRASVVSDPLRSTRLPGESDETDASLPMKGWRVPLLDASGRNVEDVQRLVNEALASADVAFVSPVFRSDMGGTVVIMPEILIGFEPHVDAATAASILEKTQAGEVLDRHLAGMHSVYRVESASRSGFDVLAVANRLAELNEVRFAEPNMFFTGRGGFIPNDPYFSMSWGLHNTGQSQGAVDADLDAPEAWDFTTGNPTQLVVVIDTGVDQLHPDLNLAPGADTSDDGPGDGGPFNNFDNHGTPVAGCVSGKINNWMGSAGVAPQCKVASVRAFRTVNANGDWVTQSLWTVMALEWAESIGARITNNSNAYDFASAAIDDKYAQTRAGGMIHFASVHNDGEEIITYPALLPSVNAVAAVDRYGQRPWFGNYGPGVDFSAPGHEILSTDRSGAAGYGSSDYLMGSGTSFASPYAAGVAALILSRNPGLAPQTVEQILNDTCMDLGEPGYDLEFGWGMVNAAQAVQLSDPTGTGACCVDGQCQGEVTAQACEALGGGQPGGRWFGAKACSATSCPPANTRCDAAEAISDNGEFTFDNSDLTNLPAPSYGCGLGQFHDGTLWFKFTATQTSVRIHTCNSVAADAAFALYDGCGTKIELGCGEDDERCSASPYLPDQCVHGLIPGLEYFLQFSAWSSGDRGTYTLSLQAPCPPASPLPDPNGTPANRSLGVWVAPVPVVTAAPAGESAMMVTLVELQAPDPPNPPSHPAPSFSAYESGATCADPSGCVRWVGPPFDYLESTSSGTFKAARLQCTPYYHGWTADGLIRIIGAEILPSSTYDVKLLPVECAGSEATCPSVSAALRMRTARYGDVASPYNPPGSAPQPDALDITALVNRFRSVPNAPSKSRAQIQPNTPEPNRDVDALDIVACVDAFRGFAYPFHGPCPCPSTVLCEAVPCTSGASCSGGTCVRTCQGGSKSGNPCDDDPHCPGGSCGPGYCRDACKRCTPAQ